MKKLMLIATVALLLIGCENKNKPQITQITIEEKVENKTEASLPQTMTLSELFDYAKNEDLIAKNNTESIFKISNPKDNFEITDCVLQKNDNTSTGQNFGTLEFSAKESEEPIFIYQKKSRNEYTDLEIGTVLTLKIPNMKELSLIFDENKNLISIAEHILRSSDITIQID